MFMDGDMVYDQMSLNRLAAQKNWSHKRSRPQQAVHQRNIDNPVFVVYSAPCEFLAMYEKLRRLWFLLGSPSNAAPQEGLKL